MKSFHYFQLKMENIDQCLQKIAFSPTLKAVFSGRHDLLILDCLNEKEKWIRLNITTDFFKKIDDNFINLLNKEQYIYEMPGSNTWVVSLKDVHRFMPEILFEELDEHRNIDMYVYYIILYYINYFKISPILSLLPV